jgi:putative exporter of polyketide antibiotics
LTLVVVLEVVVIVISVAYKMFLRRESDFTYLEEQTNGLNRSKDAGVSPGRDI